MKPRIRRILGWYSCAGGGALGWGPTPLAAYHEWLYAGTRVTPPYRR